MSSTSKRQQHSRGKPRKIARDELLLASDRRGGVAERLNNIAPRKPRSSRYRLASGSTDKMREDPGVIQASPELARRSWATPRSGSGSGAGDAARPGGAGTGDSGSALSAFFSESSKTSSRPPDSRDAKTSNSCGSAPTAGPGRKDKAAVPSDAAAWAPAFKPCFSAAGPSDASPNLSTTSAATLSDFPRSSESSVNARTSQRA